jgi:hypothetical protein
MKASTRPLALVALTMLLLLAGCRGVGPSPSAGGIAHPPGSEVVLRFEYRGGFVPPEFAFTNFPTFTLLGDGRVIIPGAQIELFPGPALPAMNVRQLSEAGIQAVLRAVAATGQFAASAEWRGAQNFVADAADTVFTLNAEDRTVTITVYGLGTLLAGDPPPNVPAAELAAHQALNQLTEKLTTLDAWLPATAWMQPAWQPYVPDAIRLLVRNADADPPDESGIANQEMPWPAGEDPATFGAPVSFGDHRCSVVTAAEAEAWYAALGNANQLTRWVSGEHRYAVAVRLLLPDEPEACPAEA